MNTSLPKVSCRLCAIGKGEHIHRYDEPLELNDEFYGLASLGGFIPGWSLVCPRVHSDNLSHIYNSASFHDAVLALVSSVSAEFGTPVIFEHGSVQSDSSTACGTSHAHLHVVPFAESITRLAFASPSNLTWRTARMDEISRSVGGAEYLFVADRYEGPNTQGDVAILEMPLSQFFRKLLATHLRVEELANYRLAPLFERTADTASRLRGVSVRGARQAA